MVRNFHLLDVRTQLPITHVEYIPNFLNNNEINSIFAIAEQFETIDGKMANNYDVNLFSRIAQLKWLSANDENWWLYEKILETCKSKNDALWKFDLYGVNESIQYTEYEGNKEINGHYDWHIDITHEGLPSNRKLTLICGLNDGYEGGETSIILGLTEQRIKIRKGDAYLFPSFLINKVYPVTTGKRLSFTSWISGPSFK